MESNPINEIDNAIAARLRSRRAALGLTLDELAAASGVSRAMISKVERGEASPTASLLARIAAGLEISLPELFTLDEPARPLVRRGEQPVWRDPATGYVRRTLSAMGPASPIGLVEVVLPPGAHVAFDLHPRPHRHQLIYVIEGSLQAVTGADAHDLEPGDCLAMQLDKPNQYRNNGSETARYLVAIASPDGRSGGV